MTYTIPAEVHTDDHRISVKFDALSYFINANTRALQALVDCEFGGNEAADSVAEWMDDHKHNEKISNLFTYLHCLRKAGHGIGFEVSIDAEDAIKWLQSNRPEVNTI